MSSQEINRRDFLKTAAVASGGLLLSFHVGESLAHAAEGAAGKAPLYPPNMFIQITPDNVVTVTINKLEMGQGVYTSMAQLIAEELDCDWKNVVSVAAPVNPIYNATFAPMQFTGGSTALYSSYTQYRTIGATARAMLVSAAAKRWKVEPSTLTTSQGYVIHPKLGRLSYGELSAEANKLPIPSGIALKDSKDFKIIGTSIPRVDSAAKSNGSAIYGLDVRLPNMKYAVIARPPVFGATLKSVEDTKAKAVPGVLEVVKMSNSVAVLARNTYAARRGREALVLEWDAKGKDGFNNPSLLKDYQALAASPSYNVKSSQEAVDLLHKEPATVNAEYHFPFLAHASMEPLNCTVDFNGKTADLYSGHQMPTMDQGVASKVLGIPLDKIKVHATYAGGSFGRRGSKNCDYVVEACELAKIVKSPVKVVWTREDDMRGGYYRPMTVHQVKIKADKAGLPVAWNHVIVGQPIMKGSPMEAMMNGKPYDNLLIEGVSDTKYPVPNFNLSVDIPKSEIPALWWRSVGHSHTAFVMETAIDELAHHAKVDALKYRQKLLKNEKRQLAVLDLLEKHSQWSRPSHHKGRALGLALHESFNSVVGHVVEVSVANNRVKVHQVWSAVHCGKLVNPEGARTQVEGAIAFGLSAALYGEIKFDNGKVTTGNFNDYQVVRMNEMPKVEVHFVQTDEPPTGLGEPGLPPIAPAVANAVFKLTGKRVRSLPIKLV